MQGRAGGIGLQIQLALGAINGFRLKRSFDDPLLLLLEPYNIAIFMITSISLHFIDPKTNIFYCLAVTLLDFCTLLNVYASMNTV